MDLEFSNYLYYDRGESTSSCHGAVRLVNGANTREGRVEVCLHGTWMTVCDDDWNTHDHDGPGVVCSQLGYSREGL